MKKLFILLLLAANSIVFAAEAADLKNFTHCKKVDMALPIRRQNTTRYCWTGRFIKS
jgi:hypothetical protein